MNTHFNDLADVQNFLDTLVGTSVTDDIMQAINKGNELNRERISSNKYLSANCEFMLKECSILTYYIKQNKETFEHIRRMLNRPGRIPRKELTGMIDRSIKGIDEALKN